jgi:hypothetical protein
LKASDQGEEVTVDVLWLATVAVFVKFKKLQEPIVICLAGLIGVLVTSLA